MARVEAVVICLLVLAMDVAAGVLGVYAEKAQNQASFRVVGKLFSFHCRVSGNQGAGASSVFRNQAGWPWPPLTRCGWRLQGRHLRILFVECRQPVRRAYELGMAAAAVLAAAHAIANAAGGCACACSGDKLRRASPNRQMASFALVLTCDKRFLSSGDCGWSRMVLVVALSLLVLGALPNAKRKLAECGVARHRFLSIGGVLCFVHAPFCAVYYASASAAAREARRDATHV
ncbi:hypothetical protein ZEAMMB73_Zm00001d021705 [Zea mays]|uniref:Uncharacterized protein n=1 Tax=Zea mays TaxID=4577 RepID=A0A1D6IE58_MAIZE|nr:hypothetical protein ZEAMMB73_Zm00001d021705 [Zea mays]